MCLTRLPEDVNATISQECIAKNASGIAMRMNKPQSKTPRLHISQIYKLNKLLYFGNVICLTKNVSMIYNL